MASPYKTDWVTVPLEKFTFTLKHADISFYGFDFPLVLIAGQWLTTNPKNFRRKSLRLSISTVAILTFAKKTPSHAYHSTFFISF